MKLSRERDLLLKLPSHQLHVYVAASHAKSLPQLAGRYDVGLCLFSHARAGKHFDNLSAFKTLNQIKGNSLSHKKLHTTAWPVPSASPLLGDGRPPLSLKNPIVRILLACVTRLVHVRSTAKFGAFYALFAVENLPDLLRSRQGSTTPENRFSVANTILCVAKNQVKSLVSTDLKSLKGLKILCSVMGVRVRAPLRLLENTAFLAFLCFCQFGGLRPPKIATPATTPDGPKVSLLFIVWVRL